MPTLSKQAKEREQEYKTVREAKNAQHGGNSKVPVCKRCFELHVRCPGPEVDDAGQWDFSQKCLRCEHREDDEDCGFFSERTRVPRYKLEGMTEEEKKAVMKPSLLRANTQARSNSPAHDNQLARSIQRCGHPRSIQRSGHPTSGGEVPAHPMLQYHNLQIRATHPAQASLRSQRMNRVPAQQTQYTNLPATPAPVYDLEDDYIAHDTRNLFRGEPDTVSEVLGIANIYQRPRAPIADPVAQSAPVQDSDSSIYPDPTPYQLTLTTPSIRPAGFLYDGPYRRVEHDWEAEVRMYDEQRREERKKAREDRRAAKALE